MGWLIARALIIISAAILGLNKIGAQTPTPAPLDASSIVSRHSYPLTFTQGRISGPGADFLLRETANAQFVMLAEYVSHVDHASPLWMAALFSALHDRHGFNYIAVEQDPFGVQLASTEPTRGNIEAIGEAARRYPYAFTFVNDEELRLFSHVGRTSTGRWQPIWGVDQVFGAVLPLEELQRLSPTPQAGSAITPLLSEARRREVRVPDFGDWRGTRNFETGHYVSAEATANIERLARVRQLFQPIRGARADELLRGLEMSSLIYSYNHRAREFSPSGEPYGYHSNAIREQLMKDLFLDNYRRAEAADGALPKVLIKAGSNHLVRGRNFTNVHSLGNMLHEFAITNRKQALTVAMLPVREEWPTFEKMPPEVQALLPWRTIGATILVDMRPLRAHLHAGQTFGLSGDGLRDFRFLAFGMDFALFLPSRNGTFSLTAPDERTSPRK